VFFFKDDDDTKIIGCIFSTVWCDIVIVCCMCSFMRGGKASVSIHYVSQLKVIDTDDFVCLFALHL